VFAGITLINRIYGRGSVYELHMIHNVRPAVELPGSRRTALAMIRGILIASAALLLIMLRS